MSLCRGVCVCICVQSVLASSAEMNGLCKFVTAHCAFAACALTGGNEKSFTYAFPLHYYSLYVLYCVYCDYLQ